MKRNALKLRRLAAALLIAATLFAPVSSRAEDFTYLEKAQQIDFATSCLTEVYGYLYEDTKQFVFEQTCQDGIATIRYWPEEHPSWVYTCTFSLTDGERISAKTPFASIYSRYPGENGIRYFIRGMVEQQLLTNWNKTSREAFRALMDEEGIMPCAELDKGLLDASYTPQQALQDFFISCYDAPGNWPEAVTEWYEQLLKDHRLEEPGKTDREPGVTRYRSESVPPFVLTEFVLSTPPELAETFDHPMLKDWTVYSGAFVTFDEGAEHLRRQGDLGLAVFTKGEERLLCGLYRQEGCEKWSIEPLSTTVISSGTEPVITRGDPLDTGLSSRYQIAFETEQYKDVTMHIGLEWQQEGQLLGTLREYRFTEDATGDSYKVSEAFGNLHLIRKGAGENPSAELVLQSCFPMVLAYLKASDIPELCKALCADPLKAESYCIPAGTVQLGGVHLRKETSSRSKDLGTLLPGTIARNLGTVPGDPNPWYHVEIGSLTGYVSGAYVEELPNNYAQACLPIAVALKDTGLKEHTGFFPKETAQAAKGCTMHVIMQEGNWLYVCIPQAQPAGMRMDLDGSFGWIRSEDVLLGATALSLEWQLAMTEDKQ